MNKKIKTLDNDGKNLTKNQDPKFKNIVRASRRAERAGGLDVVLSSGALRAQTGIRALRGHAPNPHQIRKCQTLKMEPMDLRKCVQTLD